MSKLTWLFLSVGLFLSNITGVTASESESLTLNFRSTGSAFGMNYSGHSVLKWQHDSRYRMSIKTSSMLMSYTQSSSGLYDAEGLKPLNYQERKSRQAYFDYAKKHITFKGRDQQVALEPGAQDRVSAVMQLRYLLKSGRLTPQPGKQVAIQIAGTHNAPVWKFAINSVQEIKIPMGTVKAIQVTKVSSSDGKKDILNAWFMPERDWLPAKLEFSRGKSIYVLMQLENVK